MLIGVAVYAKASSKITSLPILGGVIACGVFLLLIAILGVVGAIRHSQVILFFVSFALFQQLTAFCSARNIHTPNRKSVEILRGIMKLNWKIQIGSEVWIFSGTITDIFLKTL